MTGRRDIPIEYLRECFELDERDGALYWKERPKSHFAPQDVRWSNNRWGFVNERYAGRRAGRVNSCGYYMVSLRYEMKSRKVLAHRIVWALVHGEWPTQQIDHINRVRTDNRPCNLRDVSHYENMQNRSDRRAPKRKYDQPTLEAA